MTNIIAGMLMCVTCNQPMTNSWKYSETLVGYSSPQGHNHNDNCKGFYFYCKSNHVSQVFIRRSCPSCEWKGKDSCFCHQGKKLEHLPLEPK